MVTAVPPVPALEPGAVGMLTALLDGAALAVVIQRRARPVRWEFLESGGSDSSAVAERSIRIGEPDPCDFRFIARVFWSSWPRSPPFSTPVTLASGERLTLTIEIENDRARPAAHSVPTEYTACSDSPTMYPAAPMSER